MRSSLVQCSIPNKVIFNNSLQTCQTSINYYLTHTGGTEIRVTKSCAVSETCTALSTNNTVLCRDYVDHPVCTCCCTGNFCNYDHPIPYLCGFLLCNLFTLIILRRGG